MAARARIGFVGAGWWATANHMPILSAREDVEMTAVCRLGAAELAAVKERFGFRHAFEDYREMLAEVELDGVIVASPHTLHYEHAKAALERGLPVLCEKPMTTRAEHARELVRLAEEKGVPLLVPYGWHYKPYLQRAKKLMDDGAVGSVEFVMCHMASPIRKLLRGDEPDLPDGGQSCDALFGPTASTWADPDIAGGGYGHAQISHSSGLMFWLTGLRAQSVYAQMSAPGSRVDLYDALSVRFESGAIGSFSGAGTTPEGNPFQVDIRIFGSEGVLMIDVERERLELRRDDKQDVTEFPPRGTGDYACDGPPNNLIDLILGKTTENFAPGWTGMRSVELLDAAYRSAKSGLPEAV